ncbi:hypothetical protein M758_2G074300 [Ceratodon purpureus]|nr:hypothetical protein M758_2G074300 [Ceratodon purpureus]
MAIVSAVTPACVASAVQRCSGLEHGGAVARLGSAFFAGESRVLGVAQEFRSGGRVLVKVSGSYEPLTANPPFSKPSRGSDNSALKSELLSIIAGLDRGLLATANDETAADMAARKLEAAGEPIQLPRDLDMLQGRWRLVFTSGFATGSLGGERPGPPVGRLLPLTLGQVYQRIDVSTNELDNIVDLRIGTPWPLPPFEVTASLGHTFEVTSENGIRIVFQKTTVKPTGGLSQLPSFDTPPLPEFLRQPSTARGAGSFDTTYLDEDFRISRGDRGELRIFVRA